MYFYNSYNRQSLLLAFREYVLEDRFFIEKNRVSFLLLFSDAAAVSVHQFLLVITTNIGNIS